MNFEKMIPPSDSSKEEAKEGEIKRTKRKYL